MAAEISRHGGVAVVSPIAPFDETRQQVRAMVEDAGGAFFLVHVATPLEECERRDRKGLYAKARAGEIPEFTGISSPYEEPQDADVRVDTTGRTVEDALRDVLVGLRDAGYVDLASWRADRSATDPAERERGTSVSAVLGRRPWLETTRSGDAPLKVLFVCTANICRSPSVELLARRERRRRGPTSCSAAPAPTARTANPIDPEHGRGAARRPRHVRLPQPAADAELLDEADLVLTMESAHRTFILDEHPSLFRKVFTLGQFAQAVERAPDGLDREALLAHVADPRGQRRSGARRRRPLSSGGRGRFRVRGAPRRNCCAPCCPRCRPLTRSSARKP